MKAILEFNLPDDEDDYIIINNAKIYHSALCKIQQKIRDVLKHGPLHDNYAFELEIIRNMIPYEEMDL